MTKRELELLAANAALKEQLSEANKERAWVRRKLEIPEDTGFLSGDVTLAGTMHNVWSGYRGYHKYIAAEKCDDKMGKIARQSVEIDSLKEQVAQLEAEVLRLREALDSVQQVANRSDGIAGWHLNGDIASWGSILPEVEDALSTPFTPTALNELIEKVEKRTIERCAVAVIAALKENTREMEGYSYFGSNPGVCEDDYEDIAAAIRKLGE